ncbi:MAG: condensation domain-containing protein [Luteolibacter sp.]|uniref:condensation domain-containing protein n=1 Tax=Luteolibacter sp. TaxID=1962973 RepID=UPI0032638C8B
MSQDVRAQFKSWLESGEARLQPLTLPQRELWENSPVAVADPGNHICGILEIKGPLTHEQCLTALQGVVARHEALRITFLPGKDRPLQMIRATGTAALGFHELAAGEDLEELIQETYRQPLDLLQGPLHRVRLIRRGVNNHVLAFCFHHAIADGWSLGVFTQDLCTAYVMGLSGLKKAVAVGVMGLKNSLPPVVQTYTEWAAAERALWNPTLLAERAEFWRSHLAGSSRIWNDVPEPAPLERWVTGIPPDLIAGIRGLAKDHSTTLFSTLLAAFQITLSKWTGKDDILVGTPVANRNKEAARDTMGYYAGVVPLRGKVDPTLSFSDHLRQVAESTLDSFANAMPYAELAAAVAETCGAGVHSIFDVRFALQNHPVPDVSMPSISTKVRMRSTGTARFDLACELTEIGNELEVVWLYKPFRFTAETIGGLNDLFLAVLRSACKNPAGRAEALIV